MTAQIAEAQAPESAAAEDTPKLPELGPDEGGWTSVIRPHEGILNLHLGELWRYRDLIMLFVWRDFVALYKQTVFGPAWHLITPLITTFAYNIVFGKIARLPTDGAPQFLFYMIGTVVWAFYSGCLVATSATFTGNAGLFGKVYFPRLAIPIATVISHLVKFGIQFVFFLIFLAIFAARGASVSPNSAVLLTPVLLLLLAMFGLGGGIIVSSATTRYRDLSFLVGFGVQLLMYATPVIYPTSLVPESWRWIAKWNPLSPIMETFRYAFLGAGVFNPIWLLYSAACALVLLFVGLVLFHRVERTFMDTV